MDGDRAPLVRSLGAAAGRALMMPLSSDFACACGLDGVLRWASPRWIDVFGFPPVKPLTSRHLEEVHPDDRAATTAVIATATAGGQQVDPNENRIRGADGCYRRLRWTYVVDRQADVIYAVAQDITDGTLAEATQYQLVAENSSDALTVSSTEGRFTYVSPAGLAIFGWEPWQMIGREAYEFIHPDDIDEVRAHLMRILASPGVVTLAARFRRSDGRYRWLESTGRQILDPQTGQVSGVMGNTRDFTERHGVQAALLRQAQTDPLTGSANRILFMDRMHGALLRLERTPGMLAVLLVDIDRFKVINDCHGHHIGDVVLVEAARRLESACRATDSVGRLGGDEFVVLASGLPSVDVADRLGRRLVAALREPFLLDGGDNALAQSVAVTASVGIAVTTRHDHRPEDLMHGADLALYRAKERGRDRHELFDDELQATALQRLGTERTLRRALSEGTLVLCYQPIVRVADHQITGAQAQLRIGDGTGSDQLPTGFLEVAEDTGLIRELDAWVVRQAVSDQVTFLRIDPSLLVGVHTSSRNLADPRFADQLTRALANSGVSPSALMVEMTERVLVQTTHSAQAVVRRLRELGVLVGVANFGGGNASLAWLHSFPLDFLKIDRTFLAGATPGNAAAAVLRAIVDLAHAMSLTVVAEGVDEPEQLASIRAVGCDHAQGRLLGSPLPAADYRALLRSQAIPANRRANRRANRPARGPRLAAVEAGS